MTTEQMSKFILDITKTKRAVHIPFLVRACGDEAIGDRQLLGACVTCASEALLAEKVSVQFCRAFELAKPELQVCYDSEYGGAVSGYFVRLRN